MIEAGKLCPRAAQAVNGLDDLRHSLLATISAVEAMRSVEDLLAS